MNLALLQPGLVLEELTRMRSDGSKPHLHRG